MIRTLLTTSLTLALAATAAARATEGDQLFTLKVKNILSEKCFGCHGGDPEKIKGEFDLTTRDGLLAGGEFTGGVLVPGKPEDSFLLETVRWEDPNFEMPPKENDRLTGDQIAALEKWIELGAPWPDDATQQEILVTEREKTVTEDGMLIDTSGGLGEEWTYRRYNPEDVWAFQPLKETSAPDGINPVDYFVGKKLEEAGAAPAKTADLRTLIRRVTFDLTGLPPTPAEVYQFIEDSKGDPAAAYGALVDRLLASPHYGERWGQHWLDAARYADTGGFSNDYERSNAWRYRDYVIRAFNEDKPFDQFILEQIAGDELRPGDPESLVATGFLRMGPWDTAMIPIPIARQMFLDDLVDNVGQAFLSIPMSCCKCHDHKFDPIPTRDYYSLYSAFSATQPAELPAPFLPEENRAGFEENRTLVEKLHKYADDDRKRLVEIRETAARAWYAKNNLPYKNLNERKKDPDDKKPPRHVGLDYVAEGTLKVREQDEWIWNRRKERFEPMAQAVYNGPDYWYNARKLRRNKKKHGSWDGKDHILTGGSVDAPGEEVKPGALSAVAPEAQLPESLDGRRLALARWMASPENTLTTRSIVNRIWAGHFGRGIVATPNNFGVKGAKPTHPELLDHLTRDFVDNGWSIKRLHKTILTSATYQCSTKHPDMEQLKTDDPDNELLAYFEPRRLTAEEIRDSLLALSGELNPEMGGLPVHPEINQEVALQPRMIQFSIAPAFQASQRPGQRNRRSIYTYRVRGQADPFLEIFNQPNPNKSCEQRDTASVSPQAFTLLNSDVMTDRSIALALRLQEEENATPQQIRRAFHLLFGRQPSESEMENLTKYTGEMVDYHKRVAPEPTTYPTKITRSLVEEFSGKPFEYTEKLFAYEDYTPDAKPDTVSPETRALADTCLLLFNTNEFMFLY